MRSQLGVHRNRAWGVDPKAEISPSEERRS